MRKFNSNGYFPPIELFGHYDGGGKAGKVTLNHKTGRPSIVVWFSDFRLEYWCYPNGYPTMGYEYPTMHYFGNPGHTQLHHSKYVFLSEYSWKFQRKIASWECCYHALIKIALNKNKGLLQTGQSWRVIWIIRKYLSFIIH